MKHVSYFLLPAIFLVLAIACNQADQGTKPEKIIDRETMIHLMADMDITDAALKVRQVGLKHDSIRIISNRAYDSLYLYYNTSPENFKQNVRYYQRDLEDYEKMMDEKITLLSKKKDSISVTPVKLDTTKIKVKKPQKISITPKKK